MKITAQLALSQMKVNKKRTIAGIFAIALATSLITTVMCFVTSANKMLTDFLGSDYGEYGGAYSLMLAIPALLLGLLIAAMSITVISNIFSASANKRIQEFGILKCVGATGRQIRASVIYESLWLSLTAIPLGFIAGTILGYISVKFTGHFISDINDAAKEIIMRPFTFSLPFHISVWTYLFAGVFSFCIVLFSAYRPAKKVGKFTAIQCVKGIGAGTALKEIQVKDSFIQKIFGCESAIAYKNMKRNKYGYKATIRALSLGILLFLLTGGLSGQAKEFQEWMTPKSKEMMVDYSSNYDIGVNAKTGKEERKISRPVTSDQYNEITQKLEKYGIDVYGVGADTFTYNALLDKNTLTEDMLQVPKFSDDNRETRTEIVSVDDELYKKLCDRAGAEYGSILLLNTYQYNDNGEYASIKPFKDDVTQISLINAANEKNTLTIGGILEQSDLKEYGFWEMTPYPVRIVVPDADARSFDWFSMPSDEDDYTEYARSVMDEYFPIMAEDSYVEQGYTVRIARTDAMIKMLNIAIVLAEIVMYGFVILLILMGFTSVISTLTTNIRIRSREFAVLKSVGMTNKSLCRMLYSESIFCVLNALVPGVILGIAIPFLINLSIRKAFPVLYHIPWAALFGGIFVLIGIVFFITRTEIHKLRDKSIIDEIRMDIV